MLNFALTQYFEDEMRRPNPHTQYPVRGSAKIDGLKRPIWKEDRPTMDGSKQHPKMTAALDIGDKYSYLCLLDSEHHAVGLDKAADRTCGDRRGWAVVQPAATGAPAGG